MANDKQPHTYDFLFVFNSEHTCSSICLHYGDIDDVFKAKAAVVVFARWPATSTFSMKFPVSVPHSNNISKSTIVTDETDRETDERMTPLLNVLHLRWRVGIIKAAIVNKFAAWRLSQWLTIAWLQPAFVVPRRLETRTVNTRSWWSRRRTTTLISASRATPWKLATISTQRDTALALRSAPTFGTLGVHFVSVSRKSFCVRQAVVNEMKWNEMKVKWFKVHSKTD